MMRLADYHHAIANELARHGIKPNIEPTNGGHVRFRWKAPGAKAQTLTAAMTPSDHRAAKNAVCRVRRMLRDAGVPLKPERTAAPSPPPAIIERLEARIAQLERDVQMLLDRLTDPAPAPAPAVPNGNGHATPPVKPPAADPKPRAIPKNTVLRADYWLWGALRYDEFLKVRAIVKASGKSYATVTSTLTKMKDLGYVRKGKPLGWRKHHSLERLLITGEAKH